MATVSRRLERGTWQVRYRDPVGRQRSREFMRKVEADRFRAEVETDIDRGTWIDPSRADQVFQTWASHWLTIRQGAVRPTTYAAQRSVYASLIEPQFGRLRLGAITQRTAQAWVSGLMAERHVAPSTARKAYQVLASIMASAVDAEQIMRTPCRGILLPVDHRHKMRYLTPGQVADPADTIDPRYRALVLLGAYGGLRVGEMGALRRSSVQLPRGVVRVDETLAEIAGKLAFQPPKTRAHVAPSPCPRPSPPR